MPAIIPCPRCGRKVRVSDDLIGTRVRCSQCQAAFVVEPEEEQSAAGVRPDSHRPAPPPPEEEPPPRRRPDDEYEEDDRPRRRPRAPGSAGEWAKVRTGITFILAALFAVILSVVALVVALVFTGGAIFNAVRTVQAGNQFGGKDAAAFGAALVLLIATGLIFFVSHALSLTGHIFCVFAPPSHGAKVLAIVALVLSSLSLLSCCGGSLIGGVSGPRFHVHSSSSSTGSGGGSANDGGGGGSPGGFEFIFDLAEKIVFLFFLRSVALSVRANGVASSIVYQLVATGVSLVLSCGLACAGMMLGMGMVFAALNSQDPGAAMRDSAGGYAAAGLAMMGLLVLIWAVLFVWYLVTLVMVRSALTRYLESRD